MTFLSTFEILVKFDISINCWYLCQLLIVLSTFWSKYQLVVPLNCNFALPPDCRFPNQLHAAARPANAPSLFIYNFFASGCCWPSRLGLAPRLAMKVQWVVIAWWPTATCTTGVSEKSRFLWIRGLQASNFPSRGIWILISLPVPGKRKFWPGIRTGNTIIICSFEHLLMCSGFPLIPFPSRRAAELGGFSPILSWPRMIFSESVC